MGGKVGEEFSREVGLKQFLARADLVTVSGIENELGMLAGQHLR